MKTYRYMGLEIEWHDEPKSGKGAWVVRSPDDEKVVCVALTLAEAREEIKTRLASARKAIKPNPGKIVGKKLGTTAKAVKVLELILARCLQDIGDGSTRLDPDEEDWIWRKVTKYLKNNRDDRNGKLLDEMRAVLNDG